jgi:S-adenosylmethionine hydrolase
MKPEKLGQEIDDEVRLDPLDRVTRIIHIDRFGNCITNITRNQLKPGAGLLINGKTIRDFRNFYGEHSSSKPFAIWGSAGFLEISVNGGSAAKTLHIKRGDKVVVKA